MVALPEQLSAREKTPKQPTAPEIPPETLEALTERLLQRAKELGAEVEGDAIRQAKRDYLQRLGNSEAGIVHDQVVTAFAAVLADLEQQLHQIDGTAKTTRLEPVEPAVQPLPPSIDGVLPPISKPVPPKIGETITPDKPPGSDEDDSSGYDYEDDKKAVAAVAAGTADQAVAETVDPYAERNAASQTLLSKLQNPDLSIT
ncbi:MAG: hypothetical protein HY565_00040, partial [Candidatus Kerfeldbacteria bacterium]|nr:hypothetical protein [Candidatus Kerfeldbacteria bacterium]